MILARLGRFYHFMAVVMLALLVSAQPMGARAQNVVSIHKTDVESLPMNERVIFYANAPFVIQKQFQLQNPDRMVIDLQRIASGKGVGLSASYQGATLAGIRFGQYSPTTSRIVMDLAQPAMEMKAVAMPERSDQGYMLQVVYRVKDGAKAPATGEFKAVPTEKPLAAAQEASKPVIVLDAGHGGKDVGAIGGKKTLEKDITLQYAKALRDVLQASGRYRVIMTREDDRYLFLHDRVKIARDHKADVFMSIHADSNPRRDAKGFSIYTVSETASDAEAAALAARENKADIIGGIDLSIEDAAVADILIDLAQRETKNKASDLADIIVAKMHSKVPLLKNTHRFAGFRVLKAPDTPSVLLEIGFLSNAQDESRIHSRENREVFNQSLLRALDAYFNKP